MACQVSITQVFGISQQVDPFPDVVLVEGTAIDCAEIRVHIECHAAESPLEDTVPVQPDGTWQARLAIPCPCEQVAIVTAECLTDPKCKDEFQGPLNCGNCPTAAIDVVVTGAGGDDVGFAECNPDGTQHVKLTATISAAAGVAIISYWDFGDGGFSPPTGGLVNIGDHDYAPPGPYTAHLVFFAPDNCPPASAVVAGLGPCECPRVENISVDVDGCAGEGNVAQATVSGAPSLPTEGCSYKWNFGDGSADDDTTIPNNTHQYASPGTYSGAVALHCGQCVEVTTFSVEVPGCDGVDEPEKPEEPTDESFGCMVLRWLIVIFTVLASISIIIWLCVPGAGGAFGWIAVGLGIAAAIVSILWALACPKPCGWSLLLAWQVGLGIGIGALYFAPCCPWLWWLGGGLIAAALTSLTLWIRRCRVSFCKLMVELLVVLSAVIVPALGWIAGIPQLAACVNSVVAATVSTMSAVVAIAVAGCKP